MSGSPGRQAAAEEFDEFYRATAADVCHLVYACTGNLGAAQDATQEAYARAWARWSQVQRMDQPLSWVRTVARRLAISEWRSNRRRSTAEQRLRPAAVPSPDENRVAVVTALRELSPALRETVALHYLTDQSVAQIARELNVAEGTVKARLHRGRADLAVRLGVSIEESR